MATEVIYQDGSTSSFTEGGAQFHDGDLAIIRLRLITAHNALSFNIKTGMQITRNGWQAAMRNVIEPLTGKTYKASKKGKLEALQDCESMIAAIEAGVVVLETDDE